MKHHLIILVLTLSLASATHAQDFKSDTATLIESSCIHCHDEGTDTDLNFESLGHDLSDPDTFRMWEKVFDRTSAGEMPPESEDRPDADELKTALGALKKDLHAASVQKQKTSGRVPGRRSGIPDEIDAGTFDTVGTNQRISALHLESYLDAVDQALEHAIRFGKKPYQNYGDFADNNFAHLEMWHKRPLRQGGSITRKLKYGKGVVLFRDVDYIRLHHAVYSQHSSARNSPADGKSFRLSIKENDHREDHR